MHVPQTGNLDIRERHRRLIALLMSFFCRKTTLLPKQSDQQRIGSINAIAIVGLVLLTMAAGCWLAFQNLIGTKVGSNASSFVESAAIEPVSPTNSELFPVIIRKPAGPPQVDTGLTDNQGNAVTVSCSTCHATREPNFQNKSVADLNEFHGTLNFAHGNISCLSCHHPDDYDSLKLADGTRVEFTEVMTLCAQCHSQQMKDYEHGAHGGMNGYWDRSRGPQTKNNCVDCHLPHAPQFPKMQPTFKPRDRFLEKENEH